MISAQHLTKMYNNTAVVDDVTLTVNKGEIFGLLGPNAAGKTTVIRILCGIINYDAGQICLNNISVEKAKGDFGYVAQYFGQYEDLSVWENIQFYAQMYGVTDQAWLLSLLNRYQLAPFKHQLAGALSGGYQRRLALACALAHNPDVLFLDEPTASIDPVTRKALWDDFYALSSEGKTLFITTHYMEEAQRCHNLAFISSGKIVAKGTPDTIRDALGNVLVYSAILPYHPDVQIALQHATGTILVNQFGNELRVIVEAHVTTASIEQLITRITEQPCILRTTQANLEDVFIALTQQKEHP